MDVFFVNLTRRFRENSTGVSGAYPSRCRRHRSIANAVDLYRANVQTFRNSQTPVAEFVFGAFLKQLRRAYGKTKRARVNGYDINCDIYERGGGGTELRWRRDHTSEIRSETSENVRQPSAALVVFRDSPIGFHYGRGLLSLALVRQWFVRVL